ncbi:hypothetical protein RRG08_036508 [Elysia crispata]|uniref:Uncharacterized protein n=1 Tax=Elysia crispata TaxID=231223 RepID=A0AAE1DHH9_9GAST|nr:hypothetical protein RRG08_036508 [Elysia crispata]
MTQSGSVKLQYERDCHDYVIQILREASQGVREWLLRVTLTHWHWTMPLFRTSQGRHTSFACRRAQNLGNEEWA